MFFSWVLSHEKQWLIDIYIDIDIDIDWLFQIFKDFKLFFFATGTELFIGFSCIMWDFS
jgi:hypothetical protein